MSHYTLGWHDQQLNHYEIGEYANDAKTAVEFNIARICVVIFWGAAIYFYSKFLSTQDELLKKYHSQNRCFSYYYDR